MKNRYKLFALFFIVAMIFTGCEDENDYVPPFNDVSSLTWWTSPGLRTDITSDEPLHSIAEKTIDLDKYIAFLDLSRGVVSHEWKIPVSAKLLEQNIPETDTIYAKYILPNAGLVTTEKQANVLFTEVGVHEVFLVNTFKDSVAESVNDNGLWKVNKKFTITVE
ncbi:hypothetical protein [Polaribacter staleyi]|uniref:hypothetical protein n=1 Tax=Polaribacter staleyi TaxID=2022337 RepID=UPI0031BAB26A